jgi:hypothetical protein
MSKGVVFRTPTVTRVGVHRTSLNPPIFVITARFSYLGKRWEVSETHPKPAKGAELPIAQLIENEITGAATAARDDIDAFLAERTIIE